MIPKQDRIKPRTVEDLERMYKFERKFSQQQNNGNDGLTPFIGVNGNWWIGDEDTGVKAGFTEDDTADLVQQVIAALPKYNGEVTTV